MERTATAGWTRRRPEGTVLYRAVQGSMQTFRRQLEAEGRSLPRFCWRELEGFLRCGVLAHGLARVHCDDCGKDDVVAFSCKGRGFCPSCGGRRMADEAAWLVDRVWPRAPVRQWALSLPYLVRWLCAYDRVVCRGVRRILVRAISRYHGVLAAAASDRDRVVPAVSSVRTSDCRHGGWSGDDGGDEEEDARTAGRNR